MTRDSIENLVVEADDRLELEAAFGEIEHVLDTDDFLRGIKQASEVARELEKNHRVVVDGYDELRIEREFAAVQFRD